MTNKDLDKEKLTGIVALFIHASKIDKSFTQKEKEIISNFLKFFTEEEDVIKEIMNKAEQLETNSNQLLSFTQIIKNSSLESKAIIIKHLWKIILSDNSADEYETNLMRRVCGLLYFPDKDSGEIKLEVIKQKDER
jgi:uncharacterized tellurite resistance protein B-like protein